MKRTICLMVCVLCLFVTACNKKAPEKGLWEAATYTEDTEFGSGAKTVKVEVKAEEKSVVFGQEYHWDKYLQFQNCE